MIEAHIIIDAISSICATTKSPPSCNFTPLSFRTFLKCIHQVVVVVVIRSFFEASAACGVRLPFIFRGVTTLICRRISFLSRAGCFPARSTTFCCLRFAGNSFRRRRRCILLRANRRFVRRRFNFSASQVLELDQISPFIFQLHSSSSSVCVCVCVLCVVCCVCERERENVFETKKKTKKKIEERNFLVVVIFLDERPTDDESDVERARRRQRDVADDENVPQRFEIGICSHLFPRANAVLLYRGPQSRLFFGFPVPSKRSRRRGRSRCVFPSFLHHVGLGSRNIFIRR